MREGWEIRKLGDLGQVITGSTPSTKDESNYSSPDVCFVKPSDIEKTGITTISHTEFHISQKAFQQSRKLPKESVLTTCIGIIGKVGVLGVDATCNQQINAIIPDKTVILSRFLAYSILSKQHLLSSIANAPVVPIINKGEFSSVAIPVPPIAEQEKIVAELDCLTGIIEKKKQQLEELDNLAQSTFYDMFGDPIANEKGWEVKKLKEVAEIVGGSTPKTNVEEYWNGENPWVAPAELHQNHYISSTERGISNEAAKNMTLLPVGSVLLSSRAPIGKVSITTIPMYCNQGFKNVVCSKRLNNEYVYQLLLGKTEYLNSLGTGATFKEISKKTTENISIAVPPIELQEVFAEQSKAIEKQKELIKKSIQETETLFNIRMDYWFN